MFIIDGDENNTIIIKPNREIRKTQFVKTRKTINAHA